VIFDVGGLHWLGPVWRIESGPVIKDHHVLGDNVAGALIFLDAPIPMNPMISSSGQTT
jgi:hypothetical protein